MVAVTKPPCENRVYSEIILRLGTKQYYVSKFVEHFRNEMDWWPDPKTGKKKKPYKQQSVLARQMKYLAQEGYLIDIYKEKNQNVQHNKILYKVNFDKIIDCFTDRYIDIVNVSFEKHQLKKDVVIEIKKKLELLKSEKFRKKSKDNIFVQWCFREFFEDSRQRFPYLRLRCINDLFDVIIMSNLLEIFRQNLLEKFRDKLFEKKVSKLVLEREVHKYVVKKLRKDFNWFFHEYLEAFYYMGMDYILRFWMTYLPYRMVQDLDSGVSEETSKRLNL